MLPFIQSTLHPARYHGHAKKPPFFEGWYYKFIDRTEQHRYAVIPGVFLNADPAKQHAFVQVLDGATGATDYYQFPFSDFEAARNTFAVRIGPNYFTANHIRLRLEDGAVPLNGDLYFADTVGWPVTLLSPGIMGWYAWMPFMECYHGVVSFDHPVRGNLARNGQTLDFTGGRGYIEKDWGQSFPAAWVWTQTNHFDVPGTSLTASVAMIPWLGRAFRGFIVGVWHERKLYRFATYTGAVIDKLTITDDHVLCAISDLHYRLELYAQRTAGGLLHSPSRTEMGRRVVETLNASVEVCLQQRNGTTLFVGTGRHAGLEVQGDLPTLLASR